MEEIIDVPKPWFEEWFDSSYYHTLYRHRNNDEACRFINNLLSELQPVPGAKMLDLGCATGRHSLQLAHYGYKVTGLDLSANSISKAKQLYDKHLSFIQADMRNPFGKEQYDYVFNFFTSFGYFDSSENTKVAQNMSDALKAGGTLVIDYMNVQAALNKIVPFEVVERDHIRFYIARWFDADFMYKRISISNLEHAHESIFTERVNLFELKDFISMFCQFGLTFKHAYGNYKLTEYSATTSDRLIMVFTK